MPHRCAPVAGAGEGAGLHHSRPLKLGRLLLAPWQQPRRPPPCRSKQASRRLWWLGRHRIREHALSSQPETHTPPASMAPTGLMGAPHCRPTWRDDQHLAALCHHFSDGGSEARLVAAAVREGAGLHQHHNALGRRGCRFCICCLVALVTACCYRAAAGAAAAGAVLRAAGRHGCTTAAANFRLRRAAVGAAAATDRLGGSCCRRHCHGAQSRHQRRGGLPLDGRLRLAPPVPALHHVQPRNGQHCSVRQRTIACGVIIAAVPVVVAAAAAAAATAAAPASELCSANPDGCAQADMLRDIHRRRPAGSRGSRVLARAG